MADQQRLHFAKDCFAIIIEKGFILMKIFLINLVFGKKYSCLHLLTAIIILNSLFICKAGAAELQLPEKLVVFKNGGESSACGFFGKQGDKIYVFTSMHGLGNTGFNLFMKDGRQIKTGTVELASDRDIVRISIDERPGSFFEIDQQVKLAQATTIATASIAPKNAKFGTDSLAVTVNGIGPEFFSLNKIDKSSYILSGSPVISSGGKVVGIVSCDIPVLEKADPNKEDPKKPGLFIRVDWGNAICSRFSDDIKWIAVNKLDLAFQLKTLTDSRNLVEDYVSIACIWNSNPYGQIGIAVPRTEIKSWVEDHNKKLENNPKYMASIAKDPNHFQDLAKKLQDTARNDGVRFSAFASSRATATRTLGMSPYMKSYTSEMSAFFDEISSRINARASTLTYISPDTLNKTN
jgi:hypothetical protein